MKEHVKKVLDDLVSSGGYGEYDEDERSELVAKTSNLTRGNLLELIAELAYLRGRENEGRRSAESYLANLGEQLETTQAHASELGKLCESLAQNQRTLWQSRHTKTS